MEESVGVLGLSCSVRLPSNLCVILLVMGAPAIRLHRTGRLLENSSGTPSWWQLQDRNLESRSARPWMAKGIS